MLIIGLIHSVYANQLPSQGILVAWGEESCYDLGYKYGSCVARSYKGLQCKLGTDISIPPRCRNKAETEAGIEAGVQSEK
jgi:hypothetical protein